jgi:hypothetical protein
LGAIKRDQLAWHAERHLRHVGQILARDELGDAVDMAAHQVTAQFVAEAKRALEIEWRAASPGAGRGHAQRLGGDVDGKKAPLARSPARHDGQANARAGDRRADGDLFGS